MPTRCSFTPPNCSARRTPTGAAWGATRKGWNCSSSAPRCGCGYPSVCARRTRCATSSSRGRRISVAQRERADADEEGGAMRRSIIVLALGVAAGSACAQSDEPILLRGMGSFHIGGRVIEITGQPIKEVVFTPGGVPAKMDPNGKYQVEQMYVQHFLPQNRRGKLPLLLWHGGGLTGVTYETKPDG